MPTTPEGAALALEEFASYFGTYELRGEDPLLRIAIAFLREGGAA
ncbi:hypothetical protein [Bosea sp. Tri-44]|nr:hypothetical protein [Bosea sp. Tri-44]